MENEHITIPALEYYDLVRKAASWKAIVTAARDGETVSSQMIQTLEEENIKERKKEVKE